MSESEQIISKRRRGCSWGRLCGTSAIVLALWAVVPAAAQEALEEVVVTGRYLGATGYSGLKSDTPLRDVPATISVYTRDFMDALEATDVTELYNYMNGLYRSGGSGYDVTIRGFQSASESRNAITVDGLPGVTARFGAVTSINLESIEVLKGPSSVLYGALQPGGTINFVTKKPQDDPLVYFRVRADSYLGGGTDFGDGLGGTVSADMTGPVTEDGRLLYRLVTEYQNRGGYRRDTYRDSYLVVPSLTYRFTDDTTATLSVEWRRDEIAFDQYLVAPNNDIALVNRDIKTRYQESGDDLLDTGVTLGLHLTHQFTDSLVANVRYRGVDHHDTRLAFENSSIPNPTTLRRMERHQFNRRYYHFVDGTLAWNVATGPVNHRFMLGLNGGQEITDFERRHALVDPADDIDIYNPVYGIAAMSPTDVPGAWPRSILETYAVYLQDQISVGEHWKAVLGIRHDNFKAKLIDRRANFSVLDDRSEDEILPMAGLIFQPDDRWSLYASYSTSFNPPPARALDLAGNPLTDPATASQIEVGAKANLWDNRVSSTLSVFSIEREDISILVNPVGPNYLLAGGDQSRGLEFEVNMQPSDNLQIVANYAYIDAEISENDPNPALVGQTLPQVAKHGGSLWTRYDFGGAALQGLGLGLGISLIGERFGSPPSTGPRLILPAYEVVDFAIYYGNEDWDATLKLGNVFDETYYQGGENSDNLQIKPGDPRNIILSVGRKF